MPSTRTADGKYVFKTSSKIIPKRKASISASASHIAQLSNKRQLMLELEVKCEEDVLSSMSNTLYIERLRYPSCQFDMAQLGKIIPSSPRHSDVRKDSIRMRKRAKTAPPGFVRVATGRCFLEPVLPRANKMCKTVRYSRNYTRPRGASLDQRKKQNATDGFGEIGFLKDKCGFVMPSAEYTVKNLSYKSGPRGKVLDLRETHMRYRSALESINTVYPGAHGSRMSMASQYSLHTQHLGRRSLFNTAPSQNKLSNVSCYQETQRVSFSSALSQEKVNRRASKMSPTQAVCPSREFKFRSSEEEIKNSKDSLQLEISCTHIPKPKERILTNTTKFLQRPSETQNSPSEESQPRKQEDGKRKRVSVVLPKVSFSKLAESNKEIAQHISQALSDEDGRKKQSLPPLVRSSVHQSVEKTQPQRKSQFKRMDERSASFIKPISFPKDRIRDIPLYPKHKLHVEMSRVDVAIQDRARHSKAQVNKFLKSVEHTMEQIKTRSYNRAILPRDDGTHEVYTRSQIESFYELDDQMLHAVKKRMAKDRQRITKMVKERRDRSLLKLYDAEEKSETTSSNPMTNKKCVRTHSLVVTEPFIM